jgi:predicted amidohydrolase
LVDDAAHRGAHLIVLPEGTVPAYFLGEQAVDPALLASAERALAGIARASGATIVYGGARISGGRTYNGANVIGPDGRDLGFASKHFLWHFDRRWFTAGEMLQPLATPVGVLGLLVCADGRIPTIASLLVERGAELLVMPTAWVTSGRDPSALENIQADLMINVRARENGVPFVAANKCGVELESVAYCGKSAVVAADGTFVTRAGEREETVIFGEVEVGKPPRVHTAAFAVDGETRRSLRSPIELLRAPQRVRIAFTSERESDRIDRLSELARLADAEILVAPTAPRHAQPSPALLSTEAIEPDGAQAIRAHGLTIGLIGETVLQNPAGLVSARLDGIDCYAVVVAEANDHATVALTRTRATELRSYVIVLDRQGERAFAVDPDGVVVAGTFGDYRLAAFTYDRARSNATMVAPHSDVIAELRRVESTRGRDPVAR